MKSTIYKYIFLIILILFVFSGCSNQNSKISYESYTNRGTPIVSDISEESVNWISTTDSSCFSKIGYDSSDESLYVIFSTTGAEYRYLDVSSFEWQSFKEADSYGIYYNKYIKGSYNCERIN